MRSGAPGGLGSRVFGVVLALMGLVLAGGGIWLAALGGSAYYLVAGAAMIAAGALFVRRRLAGAWLFAALFAGTVLWSVWEVGFSFWPMVPRLAPFLVLAIFVLLLLPSLTAGRARRLARALLLLDVLALLAGAGAMFVEHGVIAPDAAATTAQVDSQPTAASSNWQHYGRTPGATRFAPFTQIGKDNVGQLKVAWTFHTGDVAKDGGEDQNTPLQIGNTLYLCTSHNKVFAVDADSGKERWSFDPNVQRIFWNRCRGLAYYDDGDAGASQASTPGIPAPAPSAGPAAAPAVADSTCARRIIETTTDARLIALDAATGKPCPGFGDHGTVDLKQGMGEIKPQYYFATSAPTVVRDVAVVGGFVFDGRSTDMPSGAVRAFNVHTGALAWAWDLGKPEDNELPPAGQTYTRSTPNVWSTPAVDDALGLIYLPTGNAAPDYWGAFRSAASEKYASSVVALDVTTGKVRWHFQTVHHDLWDYDVASQPALYDLPDGKGGKVPALIQLTKRGQIFVLDRRDGHPLAQVVEKPAPQHQQPGEKISPTQPYSVGMPAIGAEPLSGAKMWGATFFDQLACRIQFQRVRYDGEFTPPTSAKPSLQYPSDYGGMNWGSGSIDERNGYLIVDDIRMTGTVQLIPAADVPQGGKEQHGLGIYPQTGAPYAASLGSLTSFLGLPCNAPPWGTLAAIDLTTHKLVWQRPAGTLEDTVVPHLGIKARLRIPIGMPTMGGPVSTASGLVFYAGTQDYYLRAFDVDTGKELWKGRLPVGGQATPISYVSPRTGRQYVVVSAGGARQSPDRGDAVVAYALPDADKPH